MRLKTTTGMVLLALLAACAPATPEGVNKDALDEAVGTAIGSDGTCVIVLDKATKKTVWQYGTYVTCARVLPACAAAQTQAAGDLAKRVAASGEQVAVSCSSAADGSRSVGWAAGTAGDPAKGYVYGAVVEVNSDRSLPGREIKLRLESAFARAGL